MSFICILLFCANNKKLIKDVAFIVSVFFVLGILISYFLTTKFAANLFGGSCGKFKYSHILLKNIVVIIYFT